MLWVELAAAQDKRLQIAVFPVGGRVKRVFDLSLAAVLLVLILPIFFVIMLLIKLQDWGPAFYDHTRVGYQGRPFPCFKFRTMVAESEHVLKTLLEADPMARAEWEREQKLRNDPRITTFGRFLRFWSIDELPQLLNVLRGEMSLVGPRPIVQSEMSRYGIQLDSYLSARPGMTGAWQVSGRSNICYKDRIVFDANYVRDWHFVMDLSILLRTITAVIGKRGSC